MVASDLRERGRQVRVVGRKEDREQTSEAEGEVVIG
jgi:prephenate dehydrogenase